MKPERALDIGPRWSFCKEIGSSEDDGERERARESWGRNHELCRGSGRVDDWKGDRRRGERPWRLEGYAVVKGY